jgi:four helix bundle protein
MPTFKDHEEIVGWQLANELKRSVYAILRRSRVKSDVKFCDQIRESARSAPRNISEGFWRHRPREFARYVSIALGSLGETRNHLRDALDQDYMTNEEFEELTALASRAIATLIGLHTYLSTCDDKPPRRQPRTKNQQNPEPTQNPKPKTKNPEPPS